MQEHEPICLKLARICDGKMDRFKQTISKLENDVAELKQFQTKLHGSTQSKGDVHYCTSTQEFGEYALDELDTFRFAVTAWGAAPQAGIMSYRYTLLNPTPELTAYLKVQGKTFTTELIPVNTEKFEEHCMKGGTPFVLTDEIRKCLDSKLWEFAVDLSSSSYIGPYKTNPELYKGINEQFYTDISISFENTYTISPHISFYITPLSNSLDSCIIHEITTKHVVFRIKYGIINMPGVQTKQYKTDNYSGLKLHYKISGIVTPNDNLLD